MRDVRPTVENHRCVSRLSLRNAPILPCPFTPNTTRSSQFSLPEAHSVHAAFLFLSSVPPLPATSHSVSRPLPGARCRLFLLDDSSVADSSYSPSRARFVPPTPSSLPQAYTLLLCASPPLSVPSHAPLLLSSIVCALSFPSAPFAFCPHHLLLCIYYHIHRCSSPPLRLLLFFREPSLSFPSHSLIPCAILLIPLSFPPQTLIPCAFTLIPLSFSHSVRLHSHSPLILSFRAPSLSFPSHSLIPCAFTLIPPLILSFRAPSLSFPSHSLIPCAFPLIPLLIPLSFSHSVRLHSPSPLILSFRVPSLSFPSQSLIPCAIPLSPLFPCAFTLIPLSFSHSVRHPSHSPLILSFRASSLSFPSHSLIPCAFTLLPLSFSLRVCLPSHSPLNLSFRAPSLSFPSHSLIPCAFTRIPLYSSSHVRVLSSPLWFTPHVRDLSRNPLFCAAFLALTCPTLHSAPRPHSS
ncbi:unnamed protein product [Closterium sp. NIES-65]|nr:unnamed protein product [Closterium sp. NIES-65]